MRSTAAILAAALLVSTIAATGCRHRNRETIDAHVVIDTTDAAETTGSPLDQIGGGQTSTLVESGGVLDYTEGPGGPLPIVEIGNEIAGSPASFQERDTTRGAQSPQGSQVFVETGIDATKSSPALRVVGSPLLKQSVRVCRMQAKRLEGGRVQGTVVLENLSAKKLGLTASARFMQEPGGLVLERLPWKRLVLDPHATIEFTATTDQPADTIVVILKDVLPVTDSDGQS